MVENARQSDANGVAGFVMGVCTRSCAVADVPGKVDACDGDAVVIDAHGGSVDERALTSLPGGLPAMGADGIVL